MGASIHGASLGSARYQYLLPGLNLVSRGWVEVPLALWCSPSGLLNNLDIWKDFYRSWRQTLRVTYRLPLLELLPL